MSRMQTLEKSLIQLWIWINLPEFPPVDKLSISRILSRPVLSSFSEPFIKN